MRIAVVVGALLLAACGTTPAIEVTSADLVDGGEIPVEHTCDGEDAAPRLEWTLPSGTSTVILIVDDPDAPGAAFVHWAIGFNGAPTDAGPDLRQDAVLHDNDFGVAEWRGPCPPESDGPHSYRFRVWAIEDAYDFAPGNDASSLIDAVDEATVLAEGQLTATYERR